MQNTEINISRGGGNPLRQNELGSGCKVCTQREEVENEPLQQGGCFEWGVEFGGCEGTDGSEFLVIRSVLSFVEVSLFNWIERAVSKGCLLGCKEEGLCVLQ